MTRARYEQLADHEACLDRLAKSNFVAEQEGSWVGVDNPSGDRDLVGERLNAGRSEPHAGSTVDPGAAST